MKARKYSSQTVQRLFKELEKESYLVKLKRWLRIKRWEIKCRTRWLWDLEYQHNIFK